MALSVEVLLWLINPLLFVGGYIFWFDAPVSILLPHLMVVGCGWLGFFGLRLINRHFFEGAWGRYVGCVLFVMPPIALVLWYVLVLLGLVSWGRMTTWPLLETYLGQVGFLMEVMDLSFMHVFVFLIAVLLFLWLVFRFLNLVDVSGVVSGFLSASGLLAIAVSGVFVLVSMFFYLPSLARLYPLEPISGGFFPDKTAVFQSHAVSRDPKLMDDEGNARSFYVPTLDFERRNVVLIVGDALRASHMGIYGYSKETTPLLEASTLLHQTLVWKNARSVCAESFCGLMALASSRPLHLLVNSPVTLHEVLRKHGYHVRMILSGDHTNFYGLKEWYGEVDEYFDGTHQRLRYVNDDNLLLDYLSGLSPASDDGPIMFQFHLMSSHGLGWRSSELFVPASNYYKWPSGNPKVAPSLEEAVKAVNYYDNGVRQFDEVVAAILSSLESKGYLKSAVVVIVGDHGEMLGELGGFGHQYGVDESVLDVPLVVQRRGYQGKGLERHSIVSQIDVAPTILYELGISVPDVWRGVALQRPSSPRKIDFQQAPWVGFYDVENYEKPLKYWINAKSGEEFFLEVSGSGEGKLRTFSDFDSGVVKKWRRTAIENALIE